MVEMLLALVRLVSCEILHTTGLFTLQDQMQALKGAPVDGAHVVTCSCSVPFMSRIPEQIR